MSDLRQAILGILAALACAFVVLGSLALAMAENRQSVAQAPTSTPTSPPINTPLPGQPTFTPSVTPMPALTPTPAATSTCPQPDGWQRYYIQDGDTLASLALEFNITVDELMRKNCIEYESAVSPGYYIFIPPNQPTMTTTLTATMTASATPKPRKPTATQADAVCSGHPNGWVKYIIQGGDTLYSIAKASGTTVAQLMAANCLTSDIIHPGDPLFVPRLPPSRTPVPTRTPARTATPTQRPPTPTPTQRPSDTAAPTPTETRPPTLPPTDTRVPSDTPVPPSDTPVPAPPSETPRPNLS